MFLAYSFFLGLFYFQKLNAQIFSYWVNDGDRTRDEGVTVQCLTTWRRPPYKCYLLSLFIYLIYSKLVSKLLLIS